MAFRDIPAVDPYVRQFYQPGNYKRLVWSSHGIWDPKIKDGGMVRVQYTYYWYSQPSTPLTVAEYNRQLNTFGSTEPVDTFGPGSGPVSNLLLIPLEQSLFSLTVRPFTAQVINGDNPTGLSLLAFMGSKAVPAMSLRLLDSQLLPALNYPTHVPVHMVVCRSLGLNHVVPNVKEDIQVWDLRTSNQIVFDSITNNML